MEITNEQFEEATIRTKITTRGGGIEINLDNFGFKGYNMTAYQNYLGGGMLGSIHSDCDMLHQRKDISDEDMIKLSNIAEQLKKYYFELTHVDDTNDEDDEFISIQFRPNSVY